MQAFSINWNHKFAAGTNWKHKLAEKTTIVIDPNGLGIGQPQIGLWFRAIDKYIGIPTNTLSDWAIEKEGFDVLKLPSDKTFRVIEISRDDGNSYKVVEASDWVSLAADLIKHPGKTRKNGCLLRNMTRQLEFFVFLIPLLLESVTI